MTGIQKMDGIKGKDGLWVRYTKCSEHLLRAWGHTKVVRRALYTVAPKSRKYCPKNRYCYTTPTAQLQ